MRRKADAAAAVELEAPAARPADRLLRLEAVIELVSLERSTIYRMIAAGKFPAAVSIDGGDRRRPAAAKQQAARWSANEVQTWIAAQLAARDSRGAA